MGPRMQRSATRGKLIGSPAPDGAAEKPTRLVIPFDTCVAMSPLPQPGQEKKTSVLSTGSAAGGFAAAPLHPWLQSDAPLGVFHTWPVETENLWVSARNAEILERSELWRIPLLCATIDSYTPTSGMLDAIGRYVVTIARRPLE